MNSKIEEFIRNERANMTEHRDEAFAMYHRALGALAALDGLEKFLGSSSTDETTMTVDELQQAIERGKLNGGSDASSVA